MKAQTAPLQPIYYKESFFLNIEDIKGHHQGYNKPREIGMHEYICFDWS